MKNIPEKSKRESDLEKRLLECEQKTSEYLAGWQRAKADYANLKRDHERQLQGISGIIRAGCVLDLLPTFNNWKRALAHIPEEDKQKDWVQGVMQIQKLFRDFLERNEVKEIQTIGEKFNPVLHEAVSSRKAEGKAGDEILEEVEGGYMIGDKVIAPAKVIIVS